MPVATLNQAFEVPVLFQDLRQPEAFNQICDSLDNLNKVVEGIFGSIKDRVKNSFLFSHYVLFSHMHFQVTHEKQRMDSLSSRLAVAKAKVQFIEANYRTKATTVLSSNKYPGTEFIQDYKPIFAEKSIQKAKKSNYHLADYPHVCYSYSLLY